MDSLSPTLLLPSISGNNSVNVNNTNRSFNNRRSFAETIQLKSNNKIAPLNQFSHPNEDQGLIFPYTTLQDYFVALKPRIAPQKILLRHQE